MPILSSCFLVTERKFYDLEKRMVEFIEIEIVALIVNQEITKVITKIDSDD